MRRSAMVVLAIAVLSGCSGADDEKAREERLFELAPYGVMSGGEVDFFGTTVRRIDPETFHPIGRALPLGDHATSLVVSPDRSTVAFGGHNFDEVVLLDPSATSRRVLRMTQQDYRYLEVLSWPDPQMLLAASCALTGHSYCRDARLWMVDPTQPGSRRSVRLASRPEAGFDPRTRRTFLVVPGLRRLVVVEPAGRLRRVPLRFQPSSFALDSRRGKGIAVAPRRRIAEVDLRTLQVSYHRVSGIDPTEAEIAHAPLEERRGTAAPENSSGRELWSLGAGRFVVLVREERPRGTFAARYLVRSQVLDTWKWRVTRSTGGFPELEPGGLMLENVRPWNRSSRRASPFLLEARDAHGALRYRLDGTALRLFSWRAGGGLLYAGRLDGYMTSVFDLATGKHLAKIAPREIEYDLEPAIFRLAAPIG